MYLVPTAVYSRNSDVNQPSCAFCEHDLAVCTDADCCQIRPGVSLQRQPQSERTVAPQFASLRQISRVEVFDIDRDVNFMPVLQIGVWYGPYHLEVVTDQDGNPFQFSALADALLTIRRLGWMGVVDCVQMPF